MNKIKKEKTNWKPVLDPTQTKMETAFVIGRTIAIESLIKQILVQYISPQKDRLPFLKDIILNNSMLNLGAKIKAFLFLVETNNWKKIDENHFHTILRIRNSFAHSDTTILVTLSEVSYLLDSFHSGKLKKVKRKDALHEFTQSYVLVKKYLHGILKSIEDTGS
ncbi:MAG: hypothetical protein FD156_1465 [Nitrospirae bacterium]|nr:MAG: hypothetical protein FD156_1465 [Nitrospirota bacterium]